MMIIASPPRRATGFFFRTFKRQRVMCIFTLSTLVSCFFFFISHRLFFFSPINETYSPRRVRHNTYALFPNIFQFSLISTLCCSEHSVEQNVIHRVYTHCRIRTTSVCVRHKKINSSERYDLSILLTLRWSGHNNNNNNNIIMEH